MKTKEKNNNIVDISAIIETYDKDGNGLLGFTIKHQDCSFENIIRDFDIQSKDIVYQELEQLRKSKLAIKKNYDRRVSMGSVGIKDSTKNKKKGD